jgi:hypothetical protein
MLARSGNSLSNSSQFFSDSADSLDEVVNNSPLFQRITEMEVDRSKTSIVSTTNNVLKVFIKAVLLNRMQDGRWGLVVPKKCEASAPPSN